MQRATKIVATLGPASCESVMLTRVISAGVDVARLNFSHGAATEHQAIAQRVRAAALTANREIALMADLQGPKIRLGKFANGTVKLKAGHSFTLDAQCEMGDATRVGLDYKELPREVKPDDVLLLNDGRIVLTVKCVAGDEVHTVVKIGGELSDNQGINRQGGGLSAPALTDKDKTDIQAAVALGADYIAVSFVKSAQDDKDCLNRIFTRIDQTIAMGALFTACHLGAKAIIALTDSGATALSMSRHWIGVPIYAFTPRLASQRAMMLYRNVIPLHLGLHDDIDEAVDDALQMLVSKDLAVSGDIVVMTAGQPMGRPDGTNMMKIVKIDETYSKQITD